METAADRRRQGDVGIGCSGAGIGGCGAIVRPRSRSRRPGPAWVWWRGCSGRKLARWQGRLQGLGDELAMDGGYVLIALCGRLPCCRGPLGGLASMEPSINIHILGHDGGWVDGMRLMRDGNISPLCRCCPTYHMDPANSSRNDTVYPPSMVSRNPLELLAFPARKM